MVNNGSIFDDLEDDFFNDDEDWGDDFGFDDEDEDFFDDDDDEDFW
jgi:hypothetical protein